MEMVGGSGDHVVQQHDILQRISQNIPWSSKSGSQNPLNNHTKNSVNESHHYKKPAPVKNGHHKEPALAGFDDDDFSDF